MVCQYHKYLNRWDLIFPTQISFSCIVNLEVKQKSILVTVEKTSLLVLS